MDLRSTNGIGSQPIPKAVNSDVEEAIELCDSIESLAEDVPSAGWEFAEDVVEQMREVRLSIEKYEKVTARQSEALRNWEYGLSRWVRD